MTIALKTESAFDITSVTAYRHNARDEETGKYYEDGGLVVNSPGAFLLDYQEAQRLADYIRAIPKPIALDA